METEMQIVKDVAGGQSVKETAKARVAEAIQKGINKVAEQGQDQTGSGKPHKRNRSTSVMQRKKKKINDIFSAL